MIGGPADGRRFFLTGVVSRYHHDPSWNREELAADLEAMTELFTGELRYEHVPVMGLDPTWLQIQDALRDFSTSADRQPEDYVVLYLAGHGEVLEVGSPGPEHVLLPADAVPSDLRRRTIKCGDLAEWMLAETRVRRLLVLIDMCFSGQGGVDFARNAAAWAGNLARFDTPDESGVAVVSATWPRQEAIPGAFAGGFIRAVRDPATAGHTPGGLAIDAVVSVLNADPAVPASQRAQWNLVLGTGTIPSFLRNPRRDRSLVDLDLAEQARRWQWRQEQEHRRAEEMRGQFVPRIAGFIGRSRALTDLSRWLEDPTDARPRVATGDPGSGKTAVLGLLAALSDPRRRPTVPRDGLPAGIIPRAGAIDVAVYAGNLTSSQVLTALAAAASLDDVDPDPAALDLGVARLLDSMRDWDRPLVAIIDALDEAADPAHLAGRLLRPLIERGQGRIRLLLGTRRHVCPHLGPSWARVCEEIDLDAPRYADPQSLATVVRRILRGDPSRAGVSPFASCPPAILEETTTAIAETAGRSFFVACILASTQAAQPALPDPHDPAWRASLPSQAGPAMRQDLEARLPGQAGRAIDLLRPLAYTQGPGLPWEDVWPLLANVLSPGHGYSNDDLLELVERAGSYIVESGTLEDRSLYRLYHRSLTEYLRADRDQDADENAITAALVRHVPLRVNGRTDWAFAHPYIRAYLPDHAASVGMIDSLAQDPGFLLAADPPHLLTALDTTTGDAARAAADAYRRARPFLRRRPAAEHAAYLALAARCGRADALADRVIADGFDTPWRPLWASWQLQRPHEVITGPADEVKAVAAAELDGRPVIISGGDDRTVRAWDLATGTPIGQPLTGHDGPVNAVAAAELDGRPVIISGGEDGTVRAWDLAAGTPIGQPLTGHTDPVRSVAAAELDGRPVIISASNDETVRAWDLATGTPIGQPLTGHDGPVNAVAAAELDGRPVIISGSDDETVRAWDLATGTPIGQPLTGHDGPVNAVAAAELDGRPVIISGGADRAVRAWDLATGTPIGQLLTGHTDWVRCVAAAELDGRPVIISASNDQTVRAWDLATGTPIGDPFTGHTGHVYAVTAAELDGRPVIISGGEDWTVRIWDLATGTPIRDPFTGHTDPVRSVAAAELDGRPVIISASVDGTVRAWDLATGTPIGQPLTGHTDEVHAVTAAELDGRPVIISASGDETVRVWDLATGTPIGQPLTGHDGPVYAVAAAELDGRPVIISGGADRTVRVWDLATGTPIGQPLTGHTDWVRSVAAAELDGRPVIISASRDCAVRVWDLATGTPIGQPLTGQSGSLYAVAAAELDGRPVIISGGADRTVRVWDLATGTPIGQPLTGHTDPVQIAWPPPSWTAAPSSSPPASTAPCGSGTWPPAPPSASRSPATPGPCWRWPPPSWTAAPSSSPAAPTAPCGSGTWPPAPPSASRSPATTGP